MIVEQVIADRSHWRYLDSAWIMTIIDIESGFNPLAGPNAAGRYDGLMQVIPPTAADMARAYGIAAGPQTDPVTSVVSGTAYLDYSARDIIAKRATSSLSLWDLAQAYNEGFAAVEAGKRDPAYLLKFQLKLAVVRAQMNATLMMAAGLIYAGPAPIVIPSA